MLEKLQAVLNKAREGHKYTSDIDKHGVPDYWDIDLEGDCEDHALWIRQELKKLSIDSDLVLCRTETGGGHLVVHANGWILDNRYTWVMDRAELDYTWIKLGRPDGTWLEIEG